MAQVKWEWDHRGKAFIRKAGNLIGELFQSLILIDKKLRPVEVKWLAKPQRKTTATKKLVWKAKPQSRLGNLRMAVRQTEWSRTCMRCSQLPTHPLFFQWQRWPWKSFCPHGCFRLTCPPSLALGHRKEELVPWVILSEPHCMKARGSVSSGRPVSSDTVQNRRLQPCQPFAHTTSPSPCHSCSVSLNSPLVTNSSF